MPRVFVSIGSNEDRERNVRRAVHELNATFDGLRLSDVYECDAVGFEGDPFFNLVAQFETTLAVDEVLDRLRAIEARCGRVRTSRRYGPRTMDIDILTYGDWISDDEAVEKLLVEGLVPIARELYAALERMKTDCRYQMPGAAIDLLGGELAGPRLAQLRDPWSGFYIVPLIRLAPGRYRLSGELAGDARDEGVIVYTCEAEADAWDQHLAVFLEIESEPLILEVGDDRRRQVTSYHVDRGRLLMETQPFDDDASPRQVSVRCDSSAGSSWRA